jgi:hypothetical protein
MLKGNSKKKRKLTRTWRRTLFYVCVGVVLLSVAVFFGYRKFFPAKKPGGHSSVVSRAASTDSDIPDLKTLLSQKNIDYTRIQVNGNEYIIFLPNGSRVILSTQKGLYPQISSLQYILAHLTMEGRRFSILDERFDNPVITCQ